MSKASRNRDIARARVAEMRAREARQARQRRLFMGIGAAVLAIAAAVGIALAVASGGGKPAGHSSAPKLKLGPLSALGPLKPAPSAGKSGFEGVPIPAAPTLAGQTSTATGVVDGIHCQTSEQLIFHIHAHLTMFINGTPRQLPAGIGIPGSRTVQSPQGPVAQGGSCLYWLHTHAPDGIIHVESPIRRTYTLGNLFDEWGQPLGPSTLGPVTGHVVAIYNGQLYHGNPRDIPLISHAQIQLEVGKPLVAQQKITFPSGL